MEDWVQELHSIDDTVSSNGTSESGIDPLMYEQRWLFLSVAGGSQSVAGKLDHSLKSNTVNIKKL